MSYCGSHERSQAPLEPETCIGLMSESTAEPAGVTCASRTRVHLECPIPACPRALCRQAGAPARSLLLQNWMTLPCSSSPSISTLPRGLLGSSHVNSSSGSADKAMGEGLRGVGRQVWLWVPEFQCHGRPLHMPLPTLPRKGVGKFLSFLRATAKLSPRPVGVLGVGSTSPQYRTASQLWKPAGVVKAEVREGMVDAKNASRTLPGLPEPRGATFCLAKLCGGLFCTHLLIMLRSHTRDSRHPDW